MPIPNAKKPSGTVEPYGRTKTRTCGWMVAAIAGASCRPTWLRNRGSGEPRRAAREPTLLEVALVVVLRLPERRSILDLRHDRARQPLLHLRARGLGGGTLLR